MGLLLIRMKALLKLKKMSEALYANSRALDRIGFLGWRNMRNIEDAKVLILDDDSKHLANLGNALTTHGPASVTKKTADDLICSAALDDNFKLIVINSMNIQDFLQSCLVIKNNDRINSLPILLIIDGEMKNNKIAQALELGVTDCIMGPVEENEL